MASTALSVRRAENATASSSFLRDEYRQREETGANEKFKRPQREDVLQFFSDNWPELNRKPRVLSMPSCHWRFENALQLAFPTAYCLGVERHLENIHRAAPFMPGNGRRMRFHEIKAGVVNYMASSMAKVTAMSMASYLGLESRLRGTKRQARQFRQIFWNLDAAWLDFQGPLSGESIEAIRNIPQRFDDRTPAKAWPLVVTLLAARDHEPFNYIAQKSGGRTALVEHLLNATRWATAEVVAEKKYITAKGMPMLAIFALVRPCERREFVTSNLRAIVRKLEKQEGIA